MLQVLKCHYNAITITKNAFVSLSINKFSNIIFIKYSQYCYQNHKVVYVIIRHGHTKTGLSPHTGKLHYNYSKEILRNTSQIPGKIAIIWPKIFIRMSFT